MTINAFSELFTSPSIFKPKNIQFNPEFIINTLTINHKIQRRWTRFWMRFAGTGQLGRAATWFSTWGLPPYYGRIPLSRLNRAGFVSPRATLNHRKLTLGRHVFIDDGVMIYQDKNGEAVDIGDGVHLHRDTVIQTGSGGRLSISDQAHIQPRCQFSAYKGSIVIGRRAEIAPACAFYSYDHGTASGIPVREQEIRSKGGIFLDDDVWLGYGVIVLDGVRIGKGAVVGAGSVVTRSIQAEAVAAGNPARIIKMRGQ
jgi:acetyltransferase-like isoleucine patch superfamily enzyme